MSHIPEAPHVRVEHADGSSTPVDLTFTGREPREVRGEIFIVDCWESTTVLNWLPDDRLVGDPVPTDCAIRTHRVGVR